jgi:hypothetical protein
MATLCPSRPCTGTPPIRDGQAVAAAARAAEAGWRAVIDAQAADLRTVRRFAAEPQRPEAVEALRRLRARAAPGGDADAAMRRVRDAHGGAVPLAVRRLLERYVVEHLHSGAPPAWPDRDESESTDEPALWRQRRRESRG